MLSTTRLNLLPLHRLASGLRRVYSFQRPEKNTFIHYDGQTNEEDQADIVKCVSNILDGTPARWKEDEALSHHLESIVSSYQASTPSPSAARAQERQQVNDFSPSSERIEELSRVNGEWSLGAASHAQGNCKPCGWNHKPGGCSKGAGCDFCHACDDSALKRKKKNRIQRIKESKRATKVATPTHA